MLVAVGLASPRLGAVKLVHAYAALASGLAPNTPARRGRIGNASKGTVTVGQCDAGFVSNEWEWSTQGPVEEGMINNNR